MTLGNIQNISQNYFFFSHLAMNITDGVGNFDSISSMEQRNWLISSSVLTWCGRGQLSIPVPISWIHNQSGSCPDGKAFFKLSQNSDFLKKEEMDLLTIDSSTFLNLIGPGNNMYNNRVNIQPNQGRMSMDQPRLPTSLIQNIILHQYPLLESLAKLEINC